MLPGASSQARVTGTNDKQIKVSLPKMTSGSILAGNGQALVYPKRQFGHNSSLLSWILDKGFSIHHKHIDIMSCSRARTCIEDPHSWLLMRRRCGDGRVGTAENVLFGFAGKVGVSSHIIYER